MRTRPLLMAAAAALLLALPAAGQTVRAGMTVDEVRSLLGEPAVARRAGEWLYLFYVNGCAPACGSDDVVFTRDGRVVAAVFRTRRRRFVGPAASAALEGAPGGSGPGARVLGSPAGTPAGAAGTRHDAARPGAPARVEGIRIVIPGTEEASSGGTRVRSGGLRGGAGVAETQAADTALDQARQERERQVTPRTVPPDRPGAVRADTALDRRRQEREQQVPPRTVRPPAPR